VRGPREQAPESLGFLAAKVRPNDRELQARASRFLADFNGVFLQCDTVRFEAGETRSAAAARALAFPLYRFVRRIGNAAAARFGRLRLLRA
jgi:hypothetical protein